jgi:hypothetical protein
MKRVAPDGRASRRDRRQRRAAPERANTDRRATLRDSRNFATSTAPDPTATSNTQQDSGLRTSIAGRFFALIRVFSAAFATSNRPLSATSFEPIAPASLPSNTSAAVVAHSSSSQPRSIIAPRHAVPNPESAEAGSSASSSAVLNSFFSLEFVITALQSASCSEHATRHSTTDPSQIRSSGSRGPASPDSP